MKNIKYLVAFPIVFSLLSCFDERDIDLPLKDLSGTIVIEGNVTDKNGPYSVKITRSEKINAASYPKPVTDAVVVISDNHGQSDTLKYTEGEYRTTHLTTHYGDVYTLSVTIDGVIYKATSKMPEYVEFTALKQKDIPDEYYIEKKVIPVFTDPEIKGNYYLFKSQGYLGIQEITLFSDYSVNGQVNNRVLNGSTNPPNSKVKVEMQCIDEAVYNYFKAQKSLNDPEFNTTVSANPPSNISNGALGYFSAHTTSEKEIIIQ
ncbi:uncharacterized protein DUF4249 [Chryseobacterium sp. 7]|uniref:DUF4249 domain-containing protein n=1 Tax=Chryseobacterium sp. 7 TaxID=2035214 RepID=UPI000EB2DF76|nr:DUF4249 domain-containing protein [Chryseobacterium sp. 7]RLJ31274.1 uncharacterized protein DUF4249 [Chryseobacterium sp. 7]